MIGMSVNQAKSNFFDRKKVIDAVGRASAAAMARGGGLIRKIATQSMRYRKGPSTPGSPPSAHRQRGALLRKLLFNVFDPRTASAVIGPAALAGAPVGETPVPLLEEAGGTARRRNPRMTRRKLGGVGEVNIEDGIPVFGRLRTPAQLERAGELQRELYGPPEFLAHYPPRRYMAPALAAARPELPRFWQDSIK